MNEMPATAEARRVDVTDVAKMIRPLLRKAFPGVKFSVRSDRYAGGASVDISWTDGPTSNSVDRLIKGFAGARFDGMDDLKYHADSWHCAKHAARTAATWGAGDHRDAPVFSRCCASAELVHFGSDYVQTHRTLSGEFRAELRTRVKLEDALDEDADDNTPLPRNSVFAHGTYDTLRDGVYRLSVTTAR